MRRQQQSRRHLSAFIIVILVARRRRSSTAGTSRRRSARRRRRHAARCPSVPPISTCWSAVRRSLNVGSTIARVSLTVPDVADAMVTAPGQLLIHGKTPGTISLFVWDRAGAIKTYEVNVRRDLSMLVEQMKQLFPGEPITVAGSGKDVVVSGTVSSKYVIEKAADVAGRLRRKERERRQPAEAAGRRRVQPGDAARALRRGQPQRAAGARRVAVLRWQQRLDRPHRPRSSSRRRSSISGIRRCRARTWSFSDYLNLFLFDTKNQIGAVVKALQAQGRVPEPRRAEPDRDQRQGSQLPRRRRVPVSGAAAASTAASRSIQGVRRPPELHADGARRRPDQPEDQARSELARLQQRRHASKASGFRR